MLDERVREHVAAPLYFFDDITDLFISENNFRFTAFTWQKVGTNMIMVPEFHGVVPVGCATRCAAKATSFITGHIAMRAMDALNKTLS